MESKNEPTLYLAATFLDRLKGLFRYRKKEVLLFMVPCNSIHTFWLSQPIDIAFVDQKGLVLASYKKVQPFKVLREKKAYGVVEAWSTTGNYWFKEGDQVFHTKTTLTSKERIV
jgi:uncharacterized protein